MGLTHWLNSQVQAVPGWHLQQRFWEFGVRGMQARILRKQAGALDGQLFHKCRSIQRVVQPPRKHKAWNECIVLMPPLNSALGLVPRTLTFARIARRDSFQTSVASANVSPVQPAPSQINRVGEAVPASGPEYLDMFSVGSQHGRTLKMLEAPRSWQVICVSNACRAATVSLAQALVLIVMLDCRYLFNKSPLHVNFLGHVVSSVHIGIAKGSPNSKANPTQDASQTLVMLDACLALPGKLLHPRALAVVPRRG